MKSGLRIGIVCGALVATAATVVAQETADAKRDPCGPLRATDPPPGQLMHVVLGKPYSADVEMEFTHTLEDGTRIDKKGADLHDYRDSAGRTRIEHAPIVMMGVPAKPFDGPMSVMIDDPVALKSYTLMVQNKIARMRDAPELARRTVPANKAMEIRPTAPIETDRPHPEFTKEDLGMQTIDGLEVVGTKEITTYPAGIQGNDRAFSSTRETWCSVDLRVIILNKIDNPQSGQTTIRLTNIQRTEPDPALFQVPEDYTIMPMATRSLVAPIQTDQHPMPLPR